MNYKITFLNHAKFSLILLWFFSFMQTSDLFSQNNSTTVSIEWETSTKHVDVNKTVYLPRIKDQDYDFMTPHFQWKEALPGTGEYAVEIKDVQFVNAIPSDLEYFKWLKKTPPSSPEYRSQVASARGKNEIVVDLNPFVFKNGNIQRITNFKIQLTPKTAVIKPKSFVASSVLGDANSQWYKIAVSEDGIYKIDRNFLISIGVDVSNLNPSHLNIYGNGTGKLPELNSVFREDDLVKNDIIVVGESDGIFNAEDYILFHAWGPNRIKQNGNFFEREMNIYDTKSYYFIRISNAEPPARVQNQTSAQNSNTVVNSYNFFAVYEKELVNLYRAGQRWYGELFDAELTKTFAFNIPNAISSSPANFKVIYAANSRDSGSYIDFKVGNSVLLKKTIFPIWQDYNKEEANFSLPNAINNVVLNMSVFRTNPSVLTYLDKIEMNARRGLSFFGTSMYIRDLASVGVGNVSTFELSSLATNGFIWDVTDRQKPKMMLGAWNGSSYSYTTPTDVLKTFVASNGSSFLKPEFVKVVAPQNLHALGYADHLVVTPAIFKNQAERLANLHRDLGKTVHVVTTEEVYNEFSSGAQDITAIKFFAKMFYDRSAGDNALMPKTLLLFGGGTYDPKGIESNMNFIPTYQNSTSENLIDGFVSDDYFGMLDDSESMYFGDMMDIGVGRMLITNSQNAKEQVDKVEIYIKNENPNGQSQANCCNGEVQDQSTFGDWRLNYVQIADDEEQGVFISEDCEKQSKHVRLFHPEMNVDKLYSDAYTQVSGAGGERFPELETAITDLVQRGAILMNYVGHGGIAGAADERFINIPQINSWTNIDKMHVFVSATCEFTRFDDPFVMSAGELHALNPNGGAIALMTTSRAILVSVNTIVGRELFKHVFLRDANLEPLTFGEIMRLTKNASNGGDNKRSFTLIGDPALKIALPRLKIVTDSINHFDPSLVVDTVRALSKMNIKGHIEDNYGNIMTSYNGVLSPTIFDKQKDNKTLGQNTASTIKDFKTQKNALYKGKASVVNGYFDFSFIVPKDINFAYGNGKISYYGNNQEIDAAGSDERFIVGGLNQSGLNDNVPPTVELYLNDENFVSGGLTDQNPKLIVKVFDENGINAVGNGIGHDIVSVLDNNTAKPIILNEYYIADLDSYQSGKVTYDFKNLAVGKHTLSFKVFDVNNNSSEVSIDFVVAEKKEITLEHVLNYPNPFTTKTEFFFEHNQVCESLEVQVQIFTVSGKLVKTINQEVRTNGFRSEGIAWDGRDDFGDDIGRGVYVYQLSAKTVDGEVARKTEKLVVL
ncbi:MAG: type IX secretion system sortase PorU [Crocinitomicaceae bacterium]|nr:type IX secretion system sortase PorU [Crocinitomicaceae bacterium]